MKSIRWILVAICVASCQATLGVPAARAIDWSNPTGGSFQLGTNWLGGSPPGASDVATFNLGDQTYTVTLSADVSNDRLVVGDDAVTFDLGGFTYQATAMTDSPRSITVGDAALDAGHLTLSQGNVTAQSIALGRVASSSGRLSIDPSATLTATAISVGQGGSGRLDVDGNLTSGAIVIGRDAGSSGQMHVGAGRTVVTSGTLLMGSAMSGSTATATVTGPNTTWDVTSQIVVGRVSGDVASLTVSGGAHMSGDLPLVANNLGSQATLTVDGAGTQFTSPRRIHVGVAGKGTMVVSNGAFVQSSQATSPSQSSGIVGFFLTGGFRGDGKLTIRDAGSRWVQDGGMTVGFGGDGLVNIEAGGRLESVDGFVSRTAGSTGQVTITGANSLWQTTGGFYLSGDQTTPGAPGALILLDGGRLETAGYTQYAPGTLAVEIDALNLSQGVEASGAVSLAGTLALQLDPGFLPVFGDTISGVLDYGSRSGAFQAITGRTLPGGLVLAHIYQASGLVLTPTVPGDGNLDGLVTGADFTIWADGFGLAGASFTDGDYNGDGVVTGADFTLWADHFGNSVPPAAPIPEPGAWALAALGLAAVAAVRRRRG